MLINETNEAWGGPWTTKKLNAFEDYVRAYLTIMKNNPHWKTIYFDGFAGSGYRKGSTNPLFDGLNLLETEISLYKGAAERLINMEEPHVFSYYYFIEKDENAKEQLKKRLTNIPASKSKILEFRQGDCNEQIKNLSKALKSKKFAALIFS